MLRYEEPKVKSQGRYPVCEAARLLGIHRNTLLRYEYRGLITPVLGRTPSTRRFYYGYEILRFWRATLTDGTCKHRSGK